MGFKHIGASVLPAVVAVTMPKALSDLIDDLWTAISDQETASKTDILDAFSTELLATDPCLPRPGPTPQEVICRRNQLQTVFGTLSRPGSDGAATPTRTFDAATMEFVQELSALLLEQQTTGDWVTVNAPIFTAIATQMKISRVDLEANTKAAYEDYVNAPSNATVLWLP